METKIEQLKELLNNSTLDKASKTKKIVQILQKTEDMIVIKILIEKIKNNQYDELKEESLDNLIEAFGGDPVTEKVEVKENSSEDEIQALRFELNLEKERRKQAETNCKRFENEVKEMKKVLKVLTLTESSELIEVPDEDINKLYVEYLKSGIAENGAAFIVNDLIPKSYYKLRRA